MSVPALKFLVGGSALRSEVLPDAIRTLKQQHAQDLPLAYLVRAQHLDRLRTFKDVIVDRGTKRRRKELAALLLGHSKIPVISGSYTSAGQLTRSLRRLLARAASYGDRNIFFIGANEKIFDELWADARPPDAEPASPSQSLLDLLPPGEVPDDLARKFIGESIEVLLVRRLIVRAAQHEEPVLVVGDTGTGKEVVARAIHDYGRRRTGTFMSVNCAAIPQDLLESELFGHEPESFTGAVHRKLGLWKVADNGTLFLDEIGDLRSDHQAKILRTLQEGTIRPVGGLRDIKVNARVITATNRDLYGMVRTGHFREDLYYRLRSFFIPTPALRAHPTDIPILAQAFWKTITRDAEARLPPAILKELHACSWPGNARELKAVLTNLHALFGREQLGVEHLKAVFRLETGMAASNRRITPDTSFHEIECLRHLRQVDEILRACQVAVQPVATGAELRPGAVKALRTALGNRLNELELVCRRPLLFHSGVAFSVVSRLKAKLSRLVALLEEAPTSARGDALRYWKEELEPDFALALSAAFEEVERLSTA